MSSSSSYAPAHRQFLPQYYFSGSGFHRHHSASPPTGYFYGHQFMLPSQMFTHNHMPPNYHPGIDYNTYNTNIRRARRYNVVEENNQVFQQDEVMIVDAVELPQRINPNTIQTYQGFQADEAMILDAAVQQNPISKRAISKYLKTRKGNQDDASEICVICQDGLLCQEDDDTISIGVLNCGHKYHIKCINKWLQVKNLCPLCQSTGLSIGNNFL